MSVNSIGYLHLGGNIRNIYILVFIIFQFIAFSWCQDCNAEGFELWGDGNLENNSEFGTSGFNALPAGLFTSGYYAIVGEAHFWSATEYNSWGNPELCYAHARRLDWDYSSIQSFASWCFSGYSIRCLKD